MNPVPMKLTGFLRTTLLSLALVVVITTIVPAQQSVAPLAPRERVVVAYVPIMKFATLYVAQSRGLFERYGLDVELQSVRSGTEIIAFLTQGRVDVGGIAMVASTWNAWSRGMDIRIIAPGALEPIEGSPTKMLVRTDLYNSGQVRSVADLRGRRVAMAGGPGSGGEYLTSKALERGDLTIRDVQAHNIGNPDLPAAFATGSIDAALLGSPYADQVLSAGTAVVLEEDLTPGAMTVAFVGSGRFVNQRPEVARRFVLALMEAAHMMQGEQYLSRENMRAYLTHINATEDAIRTGAPVIYDPNQEISLGGLRDVERVHRQNGRTEYSDPLDPAGVTDLSFLRWARSRVNR